VKARIPPTMGEIFVVYESASSAVGVRSFSSSSRSSFSQRRQRQDDNDDRREKGRGRGRDRYRRSAANSFTIELRGDHPYGSREYRLVDEAADVITTTATTTTKVLAAIRAHRNVLFGGRWVATGLENSDDDDDTDAAQQRQRQQQQRLCRKLVETALIDAAADGEQPQALSTMDGLCRYVVETLITTTTATDDKKVGKYDDETRQALLAVAEQGRTELLLPPSPSPLSTEWQSLARRYVREGRCREAELFYLPNGAQLVAIEQLPAADTSPDYRASSGGAMARFFFL